MARYKDEAGTVDVDEETGDVSPVSQEPKMVQQPALSRRLLNEAAGEIAQSVSEPSRTAHPLARMVPNVVRGVTGLPSLEFPGLANNPPIPIQPRQGPSEGYISRGVGAYDAAAAPAPAPARAAPVPRAGAIGGYPVIDDVNRIAPVPNVAPGQEVIAPLSGATMGAAREMAPGPIMRQAGAVAPGGPAAWGNASGEGPVIRVMGNGVTREMENRISHNRQSAEQALTRALNAPPGEYSAGDILALSKAVETTPTVADANALAERGPIANAALRAKGNEEQARANELNARPGLEEKRLGILEQEATGKNAYQQGMLGAERQKLGLEAQKVAILGAATNIDIAGKKFGLEQQQRIADIGRQMMAATSPEDQTRLQKMMLTMLGKSPTEGTKIEVMRGGEVSDAMGNKTKEPDVLAIVEPGKPPQIIKMPEQAPTFQSMEGQKVRGKEGTPYAGQTGTIVKGKFVPDK